MKTLISKLCVLSLIALSSPATHAIVGLDGEDPMMRCAPEVKSNMVSVVEKTVEEKLQKESFKDADGLRDFHAKTSKLKNSDQKLGAYMGVVGVNAKDPNQVAEFLGARDHSPYHDKAEQSLGLNSQQADELVKDLSAKMRSLIR